MSPSLSPSLSSCFLPSFLSSFPQVHLNVIYHVSSHVLDIIREKINEPHPILKENTVFIENKREEKYVINQTENAEHQRKCSTKFL